MPKGMFKNMFSSERHGGCHFDMLEESGAAKGVTGGTVEKEARIGKQEGK
jgi:hypothetical protein